MNPASRAGIPVYLGVVLLLLACPAQPAHGAAASTIVDPEREGLEMADRLRNSAPTENSEVRGLLEIQKDTDEVRRIAISCTITVTDTNWLVVYSVPETNALPGETLTILHATNRPSVYRYPSTNATIPARLTQPFAGSDFWLQDLGLEFLHWPQQRILRAEMSRTRPCRVLQSTYPQPPPDGYARVLSWIDVETGALLRAEAHDAQGKVLKRFSLGSFEKVQGRYQLRNMKIRNVRTGSSTDLKFELNK